MISDGRNGNPSPGPTGSHLPKDSLSREEIAAFALGAKLELGPEECTKVLEALLAREKDPFTINDFLQAHINKLRYDRFDMAIERAFGSLQSATADSWSAAKVEVASSLRTW